jgi:hypothetical protein
VGAFQIVAYDTAFQQDAAAATFIGPNIDNFAIAKNSPFSRNFAGRFDGPGLTFTAVGVLPTGLSLSAAGVLSGTPTVAGAFPNIKIRATDANTLTADSNLFTITVLTGQRGDIGGANVGGADLGTADIGGPDIDTPLWWVG